MIYNLNLAEVVLILSLFVLLGVLIGTLITSSVIFKAIKDGKEESDRASNKVHKRDNAPKV